MARQLASLFLALASGAFVSAQQTLVVGPGAFPDIASAFAAAQPGDTIAVAAPMSSFGSLVGKGVRLEAIGTGSILVQDTATIEAVPLGQSFVLVGGTYDALRIVNCGGTVVVDAAVLNGNIGLRQATGVPALDVDGCVDVRCDDVLILGQDGEGSPCQTGSDGVHCVTSSLAFQDGSIRGGSDAILSGCSFSAGVGISADSSTVSLFDTLVDSGPGGLLGGRFFDGMAVASPAIPYYTGNAGAVMQTFGTQPVVLGSITAIHSSTLLHTSTMAWDQAASVVELDIEGGAASAPSVFAIGFLPASNQQPTLFAGSQLADLGGALLATGVLDASGDWAQSISVPAGVALALQGLRFYGSGYSTDVVGSLRVSGSSTAAL